MVTPEPREGTFDVSSSARQWFACKPREGAQRLKARGGIGSLDDFQRPATEADEGTAQLWPGIARPLAGRRLRSNLPTGGECVAHQSGFATKLRKEPRSAVTILNIGDPSKAPLSIKLRRAVWDDKFLRQVLNTISAT